MGYMNKVQIVGLVWPEINLSKPYNQSAHLAEHLLLSTPARRKLRNEAVLVNGYTSELYMAVYGLTQKSAKSLATGLSGLDLDRKYIKEATLTLKQELHERIEDKSINEQFARAVFTDDSPINQQPFFSLESVNYDKSIESALTKKSIITLNYQHFGVPAIEVKHNRLRDKKLISLKHRDQNKGLTDVTLYYPLIFDNDNYDSIAAYCYSLADTEYGQLFTALRAAGFVYDVAVYPDLYCQAICINFAVADSKAAKAVKLTNNILSRFKVEEGVVDDYQTDLYLKWQDPRRWALRFLEETTIGGISVAPANRQTSSQSIQEIHQQMTKIKPMIILRTST